MLYIHKILLISHIVAGSIALLLFWAPMLAKKGSPLHRRTGNYYRLLLQGVAMSGVLMCAMVLVDPAYFKADYYGQGKDPALVSAEIRSFSTFLGLLSLLSWVSIRQAVLALQAGPARLALRRLPHIVPLVLLLVLACYVLFLGIRGAQPLFIAFSGVSLVAGSGMLWFIFCRQVSRMAILREHIGGMLGSAIAVYTAFSAFGGRDLLGLSMQGQLISWLAPSVIGVLLIVGYNRQYQDKPLRTQG